MPPPEQLLETIHRLEERIEALEQWRARLEAPQPQIDDEVSAEASAEDPPFAFDLARIGRTLIVLGGAYLLRAITEGALLPTILGVALGLLYAVSWSILALRSSVRRTSATYHGIATTLISLPLIFEATKKFHVFDAWTAALALSAVTAIVLLLAWRRQLAGVAWIFTVFALLITPLLMMETTSVVPFALFLTLLGIATLWLGYILEWRTLRWIVAGELNAVLFVLAFLVATDRFPAVSPAMAIAVAGFAFAAYLTSFAVRTLVRQRDVVVFEIAQTLALLFTALGGAMWVAASRATLELPLAIAVLLLGGASYAVSFAFIPRRFATPVNFVSYSSLALMLIVAGGAFVTHGVANSVLWTALALACGALAVHYRKSSLALHASVYLFSGFVGAGVISLGFRSLLLPVDPTWIVPQEGAVLLLFASVMAATIRPIERQGDFTLWTAAKVIILAEVGWIVAALVTTAIGLTFLREPPLDHAVLAVVRTAVIASLTILTAWASRFERFSPGRLLCNPLLALLVMKLLWDDFRVGRPATLFASLAIVGVALILTPHLRRKAVVLECGGELSTGT